MSNSDLNSKEKPVEPEESSESESGTEVQDGESPDWERLDLTASGQEAIDRMGYEVPTEVQQLAIPRVRAGVDLIVQAKTGSGKTLAFGLPILEKLDRGKHEVQALVLSPTRELAVQVAEEITAAGDLGNRTVVPVYGGASMNVQVTRIRDGAQVVVGTPGRILDHIRRGTLDLGGAWMVVIDEADEMLDKGFLPDVTRILEKTPQDKQTMLFSATFPQQIKNLAERYLDDPETIQIGKAGLSVNYDVHHSYYRLPRLHKFVGLVNVLHSIPRTRVLIFCNMKSDTESVAEHLYDEGFAVGFLNGDLSQRVRMKTLDMFKGDIIDIMVATDVAARGIDIFGVSHVINYDVPENKEMYLHRTGRTGRAGRLGEAVTLVTPAEILPMGVIQRTLGLSFKECEMPDKEQVAKNLKRIFIDRLRAMNHEGYPDDLSLLADDILEGLDPYIAIAGLLTFLRQRGWDFEGGYDPDKPEHKERVFVRPPLLGKSDLDGQRRENRKAGGRDNRGSRNGGRLRGSSDKKPREASKRDGRMEKGESEKKEWFNLSLGKKDGLSGPKDFLDLVCRTGGINKQAIGKIDIGETESSFEITASLANRLIDAFSRRSKEPEARVTRKKSGVHG